MTEKTFQLLQSQNGVTYANCSDHPQQEIITTQREFLIFCDKLQQGICANTHKACVFMSAGRVIFDAA